MDTKACSVPDVFMVSLPYKIFIKIRRRYVGELPAFKDIARLLILHKFWFLESGFLDCREYLFRGYLVVRKYLR